MILFRPAILISGFLSLAVAGEPVLTREGKYWVEVRTGTEAIPASSRVHIASRGPVTLNGVARPELSYTLKIRVKAPNAEEARKLASRFSMRVARLGGNAV